MIMFPSKFAFSTLNFVPKWMAMEIAVKALVSGIVLSHFEHSLRHAELIDQRYLII